MSNSTLEMLTHSKDSSETQVGSQEKVEQAARCEGAESPRGSSEGVVGGVLRGGGGTTPGNCRNTGVTTQAGGRRSIKWDDIEIQQDDR